MGELTVRFPWEPPATQTTEDIVKSLQRDFAYAVVNTAVLVRSNNEALRMVVNTQRGQVVPRGECKFKDGTTIEFQDLGMCQPNVAYMTVQELIDKVLELASGLGLELTQ